MCCCWEGKTGRAWDVCVLLGCSSWNKWSWTSLKFSGVRQGWAESRSCWDLPGAVPAVRQESCKGRGGVGSDSSAAAQVVPNLEPAGERCLLSCSPGLSPSASPIPAVAEAGVLPCRAQVHQAVLSRCSTALRKERTPEQELYGWYIPACPAGPPLQLL